MRKIRAAIVGYGNVGKYVVEALKSSPDFEIAGVVRRDAKNIPPELQGVRIVKSIEQLTDVDVALLTLPTRSVEEYAAQIVGKGVNTVDSFDIHGDIVGLRKRLDEAAKAHGRVSIISAGWDPGSDSMMRAIFEICAPSGITTTNFGPGTSMGHTVAAKAVEGVADAISVTVPMGGGVHRRMVYIEVGEGYGFEQVAEAIKSDSYFASDQTHVIQVDDIELHRSAEHGVNLVRKSGVEGNHNHFFEYNMRANNPQVTAQIMVAAARATMRQQPGAYTMIEIPIVDFMPGDREQIIARLV